MILLINPPFYRFLGLEQDYVPLSLLAVGSKMKADGEDVRIKNMEVGGKEYVGYSDRSGHYDDYIHAIEGWHEVWDELKQTIETFHPDLIGINVLNVKYKSALRVIDIAHSYEIPVLVGGNHPTTEPERYDVPIFKGEYESAGRRIKNLDDTPFPDYDLLLDKYSPDGYGHLLSSRGCPFSCRFCASKIMWNRMVTYKSVERILQEMRYVHDRFKTEHFTFWDETFTLNKKRLEQFCLNYDIPALWRCDTRADCVTDEMVLMMKDSGCHQMSIGVECADNNELNKIGKYETTADFKNAAEIFVKHGIEWKAYMIIGFPYDTEDSIFQSVAFVKSLLPFRITLSFFTPYKGTELYDEVMAMGLIDANYDMSLFSHQSPHNYFCPKISRERYGEIRKIISEDIDNYNKIALQTWR